MFGKDAKMALAISQAENGTRKCDRIHVNKDQSKDIGIFQINEKWHGHKGNLLECTENILIAYQIFKSSGWSAWTVYKTNSYKRFLQ